MVLFDLTIEKQNIHGADKISLAASANKTIALRFHFDRSWRDFSEKAAIFRNHNGEYYIIEIKNSVAVIPWEVLKEDNDIELSVIAYSTTSVLTAGAVTLTVSRSLLPEEYATKTASETLFDKFKKECIAQAFLDYEDELKAQKQAYENALVRKDEQILAEKQNTTNAVAQKDAEIAALNLQHSENIVALNNELSSTREQLAAMTIKADKWDLVDYAISKKTASNHPLWGYSSASYKLPDLNTSSMSTFSGNNFASNLEEFGLDLTSATSFASVFDSKFSIKKVRLLNTENVSNFGYTFCGCSAMEDIYIEDIPLCTTISHFAVNNIMLKNIKFGANSKLQLIDNAFYGCKILEKIDTVFDLTICTNAKSAFTQCFGLKYIRFKENSISTDIYFSDCLNLTRESMQSIINGFKSGVGKSCSFSKSCFYRNFPTEDEREEMIDLITNEKGWTLSLS